MAKRVAKIYGGDIHITAFYFDEDTIISSEVKAKIFETTSEEWAMVVLNNREKNFTNVGN